MPAAPHAPVVLDDDGFERGHRAFLASMRRRSGTPFSGWDHAYFRATEIDYKERAYHLGRDRMGLSEKDSVSRRVWADWLRDDPGRIVHGVAAACVSTVSGNLLENRYGHRDNSASPVYLVAHERGPDEQRALAEELFELYFVGPAEPEAFGPRFDRFVAYLKEHRLGCKWPFLAYLAFLRDRHRYLPVHPGRFDALLALYGVPARLSHKACWENYAAVLAVAEALRERLRPYGPASLLDLQSYMYLVGLIAQQGELDLEDETPTFNPAAELARRQQHALERERIGLLGEEAVANEERARLRRAGRDDLAAAVEIVAATRPELGFDVLSYEADGAPRHLEVKTTRQREEDDPGFWLTERERLLAEGDPCWRLVRVWHIDGAPVIRDLGNIIQSPAGWTWQPGSWHVTRSRSQEPGREGVSERPNHGQA